MHFSIAGEHCGRCAQPRSAPIAKTHPRMHATPHALAHSRQRGEPHARAPTQVMLPWLERARLRHAPQQGTRKSSQTTVAASSVGTRPSNEMMKRGILRSMRPCHLLVQCVVGMGTKLTALAALLSVALAWDVARTPPMGKPK